MHIFWFRKSSTVLKHQAQKVKFSQSKCISLDAQITSKWSEFKLELYAQKGFWLLWKGILDALKYFCNFWALSRRWRFPNPVATKKIHCMYKIYRESFQQNGQMLHFVKQKWNTYNHPVGTENELISSASLYPNVKTKYKSFYRQFVKSAMKKLNGVLILDLNPNVLPHFSSSGDWLLEKSRVTPTHQIRRDYLFVSNVYQFELSSFLQSRSVWDCVPLTN